jgi:hypothetical protein
MTAMRAAHRLGDDLQASVEFLPVVVIPHSCGLGVSCNTNILAACTESREVAGKPAIAKIPPYFFRPRSCSVLNVGVTATATEVVLRSPRASRISGLAAHASVVVIVIPV